MPNAFASSRHASINENHFSERYSVVSPVRAWIINPPMPADFMSRICASSLSFSRRLFQLQKGIGAYSVRSEFFKVSNISFREVVFLFLTFFEKRERENPLLFFIRRFFLYAKRINGFSKLFTKIRGYLYSGFVSSFKG